MVNWQAIGHQLARQVKLNYKKVRKKREQEREKEREREREKERKKTKKYAIVSHNLWRMAPWRKEKVSLCYICLLPSIIQSTVAISHLYSGFATFRPQDLLLPIHHIAHPNLVPKKSFCQWKRTHLCEHIPIVSKLDVDGSFSNVLWQRNELKCIEMKTSRKSTWYNLFFSHVWNCYEVLLAAMIILMKWEFDHVINIYSRNKQICIFIYLLF